MPTIYKYQKISDAYTTYILAEPDYELLGLEDRITELCTIDGVTYVSVPDGITLRFSPLGLTYITFFFVPVRLYIVPG